MIDNNIAFLPVNISVLTISDSRTIDNDKSGKLLKDRIIQSGHVFKEQKIVKDEKNEIINILENKAKIHNSKYDNKVTLDELKEVYMNGSDSYETLDESVVPGWKGRLQLKSNWPVWAMSRVNMFLRMKRSEKMEAQQTKNESSASELDVAVSLVPSEKCIEEAIEDMVGENVGDIGDLQPSDVYIESKAQALEFSTSLSLLNRLN